MVKNVQRLLKVTISAENPVTGNRRVVECITMASTLERAIVKIRKAHGFGVFNITKAECQVIKNEVHVLHVLSRPGDNSRKFLK